MAELLNCSIEIEHKMASLDLSRYQVRLRRCFMNESQYIQRLNDAIARLANILVETTTAKVRGQMPPATTPAPPYVQKPPIDNLMTKKDVASYLKVSLRTVDNLMRKRGLPYVRLTAKCVRFTLADVQNELNRRTVGKI